MKGLVVAAFVSGFVLKVDPVIEIVGSRQAGNPKIRGAGSERQIQRSRSICAARDLSQHASGSARAAVHPYGKAFVELWGKERYGRESRLRQ